MKWIAGLLAAVVLMMPLSFAQSASAQGEANAQAVSAFGLKLGQIGEAFGDFVFHVKSALTFDEKAKVELLKERNAEMKMRQQAWLETKARALAAFESVNLSAGERQDILASIQAEHEAIIKEHLRVTGEIKKFQLKAKASGESDLEAEAEDAAEASEKSGLSLGLFLNHDDEFEAEQDSEAEVSHNLTAEKAKQLVTTKLGFEASSVKTEVRNGATVYVVTGTETETAGSFSLVKSFTAVVQADTGLITSVDLAAHIEQSATAQTSAQGSASGSSTSGSSVSGSSSGAASAGASGSASGSVSGSAGASGGASADGQAGASGAAVGGITIG